MGSWLRVSPVDALMIGRIERNFKHELYLCYGELISNGAEEVNVWRSTLELKRMDCG
jgi:hypothetical protein